MVHWSFIVQYQKIERRVRTYSRLEVLDSNRNNFGTRHTLNDFTMQAKEHSITFYSTGKAQAPDFV